MSRRLTGYVHLVHPETRSVASFGPGDDVPTWAAELITNPAAWAGDDDTPDAEPPVDETPDMPRGNASGSAWADYAQRIGVEVPDGASRDEIKAAVAASRET